MNEMNTLDDPLGSHFSQMSRPLEVVSKSRQEGNFDMRMRFRELSTRCPLAAFSLRFRCTALSPRLPRVQRARHPATQPNSECRDALRTFLLRFSAK